MQCLNEEEIVLRALLKGISLYKTIGNFVKAVNEFKQSQLGNKMLQKKHKLTVPKMRNYLYRKDDIPFDDAIPMSYVAETSLEDFVPGNPMNKLFAALNKNSPLLKVLVRDIVTKNPQCLREIGEERTVIIGADYLIISGLARVEAYKLSGIEYISVKCIDLEALYSGTQTLESIGGRFLDLELGAIGLRLEQLILTEKWTPGPTFKGRKEDYIVKILGLGGRTTYRRIKKICLQGSLELIQAVKEGSISIKAGAQIAELPVSEQVIKLQLKQEKNKCTSMSNKQALTYILKTIPIKKKERNDVKNL